jgi:hypothetical protein
MSDEIAAKLFDMFKEQTHLPDLSRVSGVGGALNNHSFVPIRMVTQVRFERC